MRAFDFLVLMLCCLFWGGNFVIGAWALSEHPIPPFMLAFVRSCVVLLIMWPFLRKKLPPTWKRLMAVCACVGPVHLGFLYTGLQTAPASGSSIVSQMLIPFATILSVLFLKERIGWVRGLAIAGALLGTLIMIYEPSALNFDVGLIWVMIAYLSLAVGSILMKTVGDVDWRQYVVWMGALVFCFSGPASLLFENGHLAVLQDSKGPLLITAAYAAIFVTLVAHGQYFNLIKKYDVSLIVPLTLMTTVFASVLGVLLLHETIYGRYYIGAAFILPCVYILARRAPPAP